MRTENHLKISALIPTYKRVDKLQKCIQEILTCDPLPSEIIIHIDAGDLETESFLTTQKYPLVSWITSETTQGPGGGRNKLIKEAKFPLAASFDDDSWPISSDYFQIALDIFHNHPQIAVISAQEIRRNSNDQLTKAINENIREVACFQNCACLLRREAFLQTRGYIPLRYAYGIEEAHVSLQLLDKGWKIIESLHLQIFHDTELEHHASPAINAAHIANTALLAYLRYPSNYWSLGILQVLNRLRYAVIMGRWNGIIQGSIQIPKLLCQYRKQRFPVSSDTLTLSRRLSKQNG